MTQRHTGGFSVLFDFYIFLVDHAAEGRHQQNFQIQPDRPVFNIPQIVFHALLDGRIAAQTIYLRPACDAGAHLLAQQIQRNLLLEMAHMEGNLRSWADEAHIAPEHIEKLWQFI